MIRKLNVNKLMVAKKILAQHISTPIPNQASEELKVLDYNQKLSQPSKIAGKKFAQFLYGNQ